jgi:hypothetical protein
MSSLSLAVRTSSVSRLTPSLAQHTIAATPCIPSKVELCQTHTTDCMQLLPHQYTIHVAPQPHSHRMPHVHRRSVHGTPQASAHHTSVHAVRLSPHTVWHTSHRRGNNQQQARHLFLATSVRRWMQLWISLASAVPSHNSN